MAASSEVEHVAEQVAALLTRAEAARSAGAEDEARAAFVEAFDGARAIADVDAMARAALGLAAGRIFGTHPGAVPAFLHEAYRAARGPLRVRLAIALARAWTYGGDANRAREFAAEAASTATAMRDDALLAEALDAELLARWGPDDFDERLRISSSLADLVAHSRDDEARLSAHLWRLTTALERLDLVTVQRQLRALHLLADESGSPRIHMFSASRQAMFALLCADSDRAEQLLAEAVAAGTAAHEPDTIALEHALTAAIARARGDRAVLATQAEQFEAFYDEEAVASVGAQSAVLWFEAGRPDRARHVLGRMVGGGLAAISRDVDWMLTLVSLTEAAAVLGVTDVAAEAVELLEPYAGRGVVDAGAVGFVGIVDDYLAHACAALGDTDRAAQWAERAMSAYARLGARWWSQRMSALGLSGPAASGTAVVAVLRPEGDGVWTIGMGGSRAPVREMKGFHYLRVLLRRPDVAMPAQELSDAVAGHGPGIAEHSTGEVLDRQALAAYRRRIAELDDELADAGAARDPGRHERAAVERQAIIDELRRATGLGGRPRVAANASSERARVAVRKAVSAAITRIAEHDPAMARVLSDCVETGTTCRYHPDPARPVNWVLD